MRSVPRQLGVATGSRNLNDQVTALNPSLPLPVLTTFGEVKTMAKKVRSKNSKSLVAVVMGSKSDWETMRAAADTLQQFGVAHESRVMSAHRTPALASEFAATAESRGVEVIIAAAGGAAHLAGVIAAHTTLPVLGVPMKSDALNGLDSLLSTVQMPAGIPVGTLAIGKPGATNAALLAIAILANSRPGLKKKLREFRAEQEKKIRETKLD
jgi:5-(carboxyamino)imidazole ribonucleotide mutase